MRDRWGQKASNGFQWKINFGQKSLVSIKSTCIIKVWAAGNRYKLHLSLCPGALCLIKGMGFPSAVWGKVEGSEQWSKREVAARMERETPEQESCSEHTG